jgi:hypothetical protein
MAETNDDLKDFPGPVAAQAQQRQAVTVRYVDRPDCAETFADSIGHLSFDGQALRIEFAVTRMDDVKPSAPMTGRRYPACPAGAAAGRRRRADQPHAADRRRADASRGAAAESAGGGPRKHGPQLTEFAPKNDIKSSLYMRCRVGGGLL